MLYVSVLQYNLNNFHMLVAPNEEIGNLVESLESLESLEIFQRYAILEKHLYPHA